MLLKYYPMFEKTFGLMSDYSPEWKRVVGIVGGIGTACMAVMILVEPARADEAASSSRSALESETRSQGESAAQRQALMRERRDESDKLRAILENEASTPEEKRKAMEAFRAKSEVWREAMFREIPRRTQAEKAAAREKRKEWISRLPEERRKLMESQLAISEEMEKLRSEEKSLSPEERRTRMQALMDRRREVMEVRSAALAAEAARMSGDASKRPESPFQRAVKAEKQKLDTALASNDPEQRRAAMENFRMEMNKIRDARRQEMELRRGETIPPPMSPEPPAEFRGSSSPP